MILKYSIAVLAIAGLMILWALIQYLWGKTFKGEHQDADVLAGRSSCGSCGCGTVCKLKKKSVKN